MTTLSPIRHYCFDNVTGVKPHKENAFSKINALLCKKSFWGSKEEMKTQPLPFKIFWTLNRPFEYLGQIAAQATLSVEQTLIGHDNAPIPLIGNAIAAAVAGAIRVATLVLPLLGLTLAAGVTAVVATPALVAHKIAVAVSAVGALILKKAVELRAQKKPEVKPPVTEAPKPEITPPKEEPKVEEIIIPEVKEVVEEAEEKIAEVAVIQETPPVKANKWMLMATAVSSIALTLFAYNFSSN